MTRTAVSSLFDGKYIVDSQGTRPSSEDQDWTKSSLLTVAFGLVLAIIKKACGLRWEDSRCEADEELVADRDEAWNLVNRAIGQMFGQIGIMTREGLQEKKSLKTRTRKLETDP